MVKIASWNINSINSRLPHLLVWLKEEQPDIVLLQELKCINEKFPASEIEDLGYNIAVNGQKSYNGVAILSRFPLEDISIDLTNDPDVSHARYIEALASVNGKVLRVASVYIPNGQDVGTEKFYYKLKFFDALVDHTKMLLKLDEPLVIGGDFNVAPEEIDIYDPLGCEGSLCFNEEERARYRKLLYLGLADSFRAINPDKQEFSWWDYRAGAWQKNLGIRIDHLLLSSEATDILQNSYIDKSLRNLPKASDHTAVLCELKL